MRAKQCRTVPVTQWEPAMRAKQCRTVPVTQWEPAMRAMAFSDRFTRPRHGAHPFSGTFAGAHIPVILL